MPVIRACSPAGVRGLNVLELYRDVAEYFLVDLPKEGSAHDVLPGEVARAAADMGKPVFLAGGLTAQNVGALLAAARPFGVDVARGVEAEPGRKDREKIRSFMTAVRASPVYS
jgi:phosphoribosylanthranilate isomerase